MAYASTTLTVLLARLSDRYDGVAFWTSPEATDAINEALWQFNLYTGYWRGSVNVVTNAADRFLSVGATLTAATRVTRSGKVLTRKSIVELYRSRRNWRTQSTTSGSPVPATIREWAPVGLATIAIWPADAAGGTTITIEAVKITPILSAGGDFVDIGDEEIDTILDEALFILGFKLPSEAEAFKPRHQAFMQACLAKNDQLRASSYFRRVLGLPQQQRLEPIRVAQDEEPA
jgi:hypothetical protein